MKVLKSFVFMFLAVILLSNESLASSKQFTDVSSSHWAKSSIDYLTDRQIIFGYQDGRFGANDKITRAQAASMIMTCPRANQLSIDRNL